MKQEQRTTPYRPWLTRTGVARSTEELKVLSKSWSLEAWNAYLKWYEGKRREGILHTDIYDQHLDLQTETVFASCGPTPKLNLQPYCRHLLSTLPPMQAHVMGKLFLDGRTQREVAAEIKRSQKTVDRIKSRAITSLKRGRDGDKRLTRRIMRGSENSRQQDSTKIWNQKLGGTVKEPRRYRPENQAHEFANHKVVALRLALQSLSPMQQKIVYLHFFCEQPLNKIARELNIGINVAQNVLDVAVVNIKRNVVAIKTGSYPGEENLCA